jgi:hypothetical protein
MEADHLTFDVYSLDSDNLVTRLFANLSLPVAEILSGGEREDFDNAIMYHGWSGTSPAWSGFKPIVIMPHGELLKHEQFAFLIELAG